MVSPSDYVQIVGQTFVKHEQRPLLTIGQRHWTRLHLGRIGCPHPVAASNLNRVVQQLQITTLSELAARVHEVGMYGGLGVTSYWVVLSILREAGYEPTAVHGETVSYGALKTRALKQQRKDGEATTRRRRRKRG